MTNTTKIAMIISFVKNSQGPNSSRESMAMYWYRWKESNLHPHVRSMVSYSLNDSDSILVLDCQ